MTMTANEMIISRGLEHDLPMMEKYIEVTHPDLPRTHIPFAEYLMHWNKAKEVGGLFELFGGQLMVSKQITYERNETEMRREMDNSSFYGESRAVCDTIKVIVEDILEFYVSDWQDRRYLMRYLGDYYIRSSHGPIQFSYNGNPDIINFYILASLLVEYIDTKRVWLDNELCYEGNYSAGTLPGCSKKLLLPSGIKPVRAVNRFIDFVRTYYKEVRNCESMEAIDLLAENLETLRQTVSMITNQKKITGKLTLSIHPFDFMTMSDPGNGWTSCMRWDANDPGEYHAGTLEMMTSSSVIVAYLESKDRIHPAELEETWNKKKWRELIVVDRMFINGIKGYPYKNDTLEDMVFEMLSDLAAKNWNVTFNTNNIVSVNDDHLYGMKLCTNFMYNDWAYNTSRAIVAEGVDAVKEFPCYYYYGNTCYCLACGKSRGGYDEDEGEAYVLWCADCDPVVHCPICGRRMREETLIPAPDGRYVCENCLDDYVPCAECGDEHYSADMERFTLQYRYSNSHMFHYYHFYLCEKHAYKFYEKVSYTRRIGNYVERLNEDTLEWLKVHLSDFFNIYNDNEIVIIAKWQGIGEKPSMVEG